jgi:hypothetical protein
MFCNHCGKQIPDQVKFCNFCGAPQAQAAPPAPQQASPAPAGTQPNPFSFTPPPQPPVAPKNNKALAIVGTLVLLALLGGIIALAVINNGKNISASSTAPGFSHSAAESNDSWESKTDVYELGAQGLIDSQFRFSYRGGQGSGNVYHITGFINIYDTAAAGSYVTQIKSDVSIVQSHAQQNGIKNFSIQEQEGENSYAITFSFSSLDSDGREKAAELAAKFIGISSKNGKINIATVTQEMKQMGYHLATTE